MILWLPPCATSFPEYWVLQSAKQRCRNPRNKDWHYYGGRGVTIAEEWCWSFWNFMRDVGPRPSPYHSLDRIDNDAGYFKGNVRWATAEIQNRNKRQRMRPGPSLGRVVAGSEVILASLVEPARNSKE